MKYLIATPAVPPPEEIRRVAEEVVSRPYFHIETVPSDAPPLWLEVLERLLYPFVWLFRSLDGLPDVLRWVIVIGCVLVLALILAHIFYTLSMALRVPRSQSGDIRALAEPEVNPADLESEAVACEGSGDYIGAIRLLFRSALRRIELVEQRRFRPGFTNRELLRRYRNTPLANSLERFVETLDFKWYGDSPCERHDYLACRTEHERIRLQLQGGTADAPGA